MSIVEELKVEATKRITPGIVCSVFNLSPYPIYSLYFLRTGVHKNIVIEFSGSCKQSPGMVRAARQSNQVRQFFQENELYNNIKLRPWFNYVDFEMSPRLQNKRSIPKRSATHTQFNTNKKTNPFITKKALIISRPRFCVAIFQPFHSDLPIMSQGERTWFSKSDQIIIAFVSIMCQQSLPSALVATHRN